MEESGLSRDWCPVLEFDPSEPGKLPIDGWIFVRQEGKVREIDRRRLEVVDGHGTAHLVGRRMAGLARLAPGG